MNWFLPLPFFRSSPVATDFCTVLIFGIAISYAPSPLRTLAFTFCLISMWDKCNFDLHLIYWCGAPGRIQKIPLVQRYSGTDLSGNIFTGQGLCSLSYDSENSQEKKIRKISEVKLVVNITLLPLLITHLLLIMGCVLKWWLGEWGTERKLENAKMIKGFFFFAHMSAHMYTRESRRVRERRGTFYKYFWHTHGLLLLIECTKVKLSQQNLLRIFNSRKSWSVSFLDLRSHSY